MTVVSGSYQADVWMFDILGDAIASSSYGTAGALVAAKRNIVRNCLFDYRNMVVPTDTPTIVWVKRHTNASALDNDATEVLED